LFFFIKHSAQLKVKALFSVLVSINITTRSARDTEFIEMKFFFHLPGYQPAFANDSSVAGRYRQMKTISS
jgi:hypothetical protein